MIRSFQDSGASMPFMFKEHERVRIVRILTRKNNILSSKAVPKIGDIGVVVDVYSKPFEGYCVEHSSDDYEEAWLADFSPDELEKA